MTSPSSWASFSISFSCDSPERFTSRTTAALKSASGLWPSSAENWRSSSCRDSLSSLGDELLDLVLDGGAAVAAEVLGDQLGELVGVRVEHLRHRAAVLAEEALELLLEALADLARALGEGVLGLRRRPLELAADASTSAPVASRSSTRAPISSASVTVSSAAMSRSRRRSTSSTSVRSSTTRPSITHGAAAELDALVRELKFVHGFHVNQVER